MAGKKVRNEVEGIRNELQNLSEAVWALREHVTIQTAAAAAATSPGRTLSVVPATEVATDLTVGRGERGTVVTKGVVRDASDTREYRWDLEANVEDLLAIDDDSASRLLAAIGHRQRLAILKAVLHQPTSAADLVSSLDLGTTGAAYHHLNVLQSADLVTQESRGVFVIQPHRVSALFAIFAGIASAGSTSMAEPASPDEAEPDDGSGKRKKRKAA